MIGMLGNRVLKQQTFHNGALFNKAPPKGEKTKWRF